MGLTIRGKTTGNCINWTYSVLHRVRWAALRFCGAPNFLDTENVLKAYGFDVDFNPALLCLIDKNKMLTYLTAIQKAGYLFPNLMLHSDCSGSYTHKGKALRKGWEQGNLKELVEELTVLIRGKKLKGLGVEEEIRCAKSFLKLVKAEFKNPKGAILFH